MSKVPGLWQSEWQGLVPWRVQAYENAERGGRLYIRWWHRGTKHEPGNWRKRVLKDEKGRTRTLRTADGKIIKARQAWAEAEALAKYNELVATQGAGAEAKEQPTAEAPHRLTIAEGRRLAFDPKMGRYPTRTQHAKEVRKALEFAEQVLSAEGITEWEQIRKRHLKLLWRARIRQLRTKQVTGHRGAERTMVDFLAVASWLRDEEHLPPHACVPHKTWKQDLKADWMEITESPDEPQPERPRHTLDEMRRIMAKAHAVDPRFELLMALGAEQRLGQVSRAWRSALNVAHATFRIPSRKKKKGALLELTAGQMAVVRRALTTGYLRELERTALDYPLFPGGQLAHGRKGEGVAVERHRTAPSVDMKRTVRLWFYEAERLAEVAHIKGRGPYGLRRRAVDAALDEEISQGGLQASGGWTNSKIPQEIYAEQERAKDRREAREVRAKIRGEIPEARPNTATENAGVRTHGVPTNDARRPDEDGATTPQEA